LTISLPTGLKLRCHPHSAAASGVLYTGYPEWSEMLFALRFLRAGDVFVDVGANIGVYSLLAASVPGVAVVAFEPSTRSFDRLAENVLLNGIQDCVSIRKEAVGAKRGTGHLTIGHDSMNRVASVAQHAETEPVILTTLDEALGGLRERVALVKVDVEGLEGDVLIGAIDLVSSVGPAIIVEVNDLDACKAILEPFGYRTFAYDPTSEALVAFPGLSRYHCNAIFIRDDKVRDRHFKARSAWG